MPQSPSFIHEPARRLPVWATVDVCVLGGSCTGVFAAVRAARLGASVAIVDKQNAFGGVATNALVNVWHSLHDTEDRRRIIAGLTDEVVCRLEKRQAVNRRRGSPDIGFVFNSAELKIELDELVLEHRIRPFLHTFYCAPSQDADGRLRAVVLENKNGRGAIAASIFIDATGDGDLAMHAGIPFSIDPHLQPPTTCALVRDFHAPGVDFKALYNAHRQEFALVADRGWSGATPGAPEVTMVAETHVFGANTADANTLTQAEIEGRRQMRAMLDLLRAHRPDTPPPVLLALPSTIGIRETRRFQAEYTLTEADVLHGRPFADGIANGSYRVDVHHPSGGGFIFKYLDGTTLSLDANGWTKDRWRPPTPDNPTFYQIPYRSMVHRAVPNLIMAGRMIAADRGALGAIRVMVNLNQVGEAAGVAAFLALDGSRPVADLDPAKLRQQLAAGGSLIAP